MSSNDSPIQRNAGNKKRQYIIIGATAAVLLTIALGGMFLFDTGVAEVTKTADKATVVGISKPGSVQDSETWRATQAVRQKEYEEDLKKAKDTQEELKSKLAGQEKQFEAIRVEMDTLRRGQTALPAAAGAQPGAGGSPANGPLNPSGAPSNGRVLNAPPSHGGLPNAGPFNQALPDAPKPEMEIIVFDGKDSGAPGAAGTGASADSKPTVAMLPARAELSQQKARPGDFIPANTFVKAVMLNGVDAPTGGQGQGVAGNPHPIHFHITDFANLPNLRKLNVTDCRVMAAATGDISSERVIARVENMTCVLPNGQAIELPARGHVIGEDGKFGIRGRLVSKQGQVIASQILAEFARGLGNGFRQAATIQSTSALGVTSTVDNSRLGQAAIGSGFAGGATALANYYTNLANKLFPVIEADAGRFVEIVFSQGLQMPGSLAGLDSSINTRPITRKGSNNVED